MHIAVAGLGYVGLSNAVLLAQNHVVTAVDISASRVDMVNRRQCPIIDEDLQAFLSKRDLQVMAGHGLMG